MIFVRSEHIINTIPLTCFVVSYTVANTCWWDKLNNGVFNQYVMCSVIRMPCICIYSLDAITLQTQRNVKT